MVMINQLLVVIQGRLEAVLQASHPHPEKLVIIANPVEVDGSAVQGLANKILMSLVSLQTDPSSTSFAAPQQGAGNTYPVTAPRMILDAFVLIAPNFTGPAYISGLGLLSEIISYLQGVPVLTPAEFPELPKDFDRVALEFVSLDFAAANNLMMIVGMKCFPFLLYRLRRLNFDGNALSGVSPPVLGGVARTSLQGGQ